MEILRSHVILLLFSYTVPRVLHIETRSGPISMLGQHRNIESQAAITSVSTLEGHASQLFYESEEAKMLRCVVPVNLCHFTSVRLHKYVIRLP